MHKVWVYMYLVIVYLVSCLFSIHTMFFLFSYVGLVALGKECSPTNGLAHTALIGPIGISLFKGCSFGVWGLKVVLA